MRNAHGRSGSEEFYTLSSTAYTVLLLVVEKMENKKAWAITLNPQSRYIAAGGSCNHKLLNICPAKKEQ